MLSRRRGGTIFALSRDVNPTIRPDNGDDDDDDDDDELSLRLR